MGNVYIGVNNIAKKVNSIYVGVSNKARKVQKAYVGVSNKARLVYQSGPDTTKTAYTEAEVNELAVYGVINQVPVGSTFTIANSQDTNRSVHTYIVIGKDHKDLNIDNYPSESAATGTVDVWATGAIVSMAINAAAVRRHGQYNINAGIRYWLNDSFYNGFNATTKVHLKQMTVEYYFTTETLDSSTAVAKGNNNTTDYVKLLSTKEFNPSSYDTYMHQREGNGYEYFPSVSYSEGNTANALKRYASATGTANASSQWRRSLRCFKGQSGSYAWRVTSYGSLAQGGKGQDPNGVVPCFRLGA